MTYELGSSLKVNPADFRSSVFSSVLKARGAGGTLMLRPPADPFITSIPELGPVGPLRTIRFGISLPGVPAFGKSGLMLRSIVDGTLAACHTFLSLLRPP